MILEFTDGSQLECLRIFGKPVTYNGIERDTLSIEISPDDTSLEHVRTYFLNPSNMEFIYSRKSSDAVKETIGTGYMILVDSRTENRRVKHRPGEMVPETYQDVIIITIAQLTYQEYQDWKNGTGEIPILSE